jgi:hypothetical protein
MTRQGAPILEPVPMTDRCDLYEINMEFAPPLVKGSDRERVVSQTLEGFGLRVQAQSAIGKEEDKDGTELTEGYELVAVARGNETNLHSYELHQALIKNHGAKITSVKFVKSLTPDRKPRSSLFKVHVRCIPEVRLNDVRDQAIDRVFRDLGVRVASRHISSGGTIGRYPEVMSEVDMFFMVPDGLECELYSSRLNSALAAHGAAVTHVQFVKGLMSEAVPTSGEQHEEEKNENNTTFDDVKKDLETTLAKLNSVKENLAEIKDELKETRAQVRRSEGNISVFLVLIVILIGVACVVTTTNMASYTLGLESLLDRQWNATQALNTTLSKTTSMINATDFWMALAMPCACIMIVNSIACAWRK